MASINSQIKPAWQKSLKKISFKKNLILTVPLFLFVLFLLSTFLNYNEFRPGFTFNDPVLKLFDPIDLTWLTFILIYAALIIALIYLLREPESLLIAIQTYTIMALVRIAAMYLLPLDPPENLIPLVDPLVQLTGGGLVLKKDLFFSGHTSTMFLLFLSVDKKSLKYTFLLCTILVGFTVLLQHVHYSIDIFAAPFFAYGSFVIAKRINKRM